MSRPYDVIQHKETRIGRFNIVQDTIEIDGEKYPYSYNKVEDCVCILPIKGDNIVLIKQYRHALDEIFIEIPAGGIGENDIENAARIELLEETGYVAGKITYYGAYPVSQGTSTAMAYMFLAEELSYQGVQKEPTEFIEQIEVSREDFERMIYDKQFTHMVGIVLWYLYKYGKVARVES